MVGAHPAALNRKQRKALARRLRVEDPGLDVMHPHAAGSTWGTARVRSGARTAPEGRRGQGGRHRPSRGAVPGARSRGAALGAQHRRLRGKLGAPKAITAMAPKLARLVFRLLTWGHAYVDKGQQYYEERHRDQQVQLLMKRAAKLGLQLVAPEIA